jgi:hypothetical protein
MGLIESEALTTVVVRPFRKESDIVVYSIEAFRTMLLPLVRS